MIRQTILVATIALLPASQAMGQAPAKTQTPAKQMAEDVEIFRRILQKKVMESPQPALAVKAACSTCHASSNVRLWNAQDGRELLRLWWPDDPDKDHGYIYPDQRVRALAFSPDGERLAAVHALHRQPTTGFAPHVEGTYLKGQGVFLTMTLPATGKDPRAETGKAGPKPLSDWERARQEVRGQKTAPPPAAADRPEPGLADVILRVLADNGKHVAQLPGEESITVVVTFRVPASLPVADLVNALNAQGIMRELSDQEFIRRVYLDVLGRVPTGEEIDHASKVTSAKGREKLIDELLAKSSPQAQAAHALLGFVQDRTATNEHELLGDLHLKQNRYQEAINAYEKAAGQKPKPAELAEIYRKLAQAHLAMQNVARARQLLDQLQKLKDESGKTPPAKPDGSASPPLPAKLTITAPKKLLDLIGAGKITWEEFKKAATMEYQTFE